MFQEFFTDTLGSRYIKTLLQETPFPVFDAVVDGDTLISINSLLFNVRTEESSLLTHKKSCIPPIYYIRQSFCFL